MKWRQVTGLEAVKFARSREPIESSAPPSFVSEEETILFTDGSAIRIRVDDSGFGGSDVTPPDPHGSC